jgi:uridylate kinase
MPKLKRKYKRVLLKISGEAFCAENSSGIDDAKFAFIAREIRNARTAGAEIAIVVGGGNILRGAILSKSGIDRTHADHLGMIATVINAIILQDSLKKLKIPACVLSAIQIQNIVEPYGVQKCLNCLKKGYVVIIAGGTGNPYFTTDTGAALRAIEIEADIFLKGTKVDGVYSDDPLSNPSANKYTKLKYMDVLEQKLGIIDFTAISLSMANNLPIMVFNIRKKHNIKKAIIGSKIGTYIGNN